MPSFSVYSWDLYSVPGLTQTELETSTHGNDPDQTGANPYNPSAATWTGTDFTFNGGSATQVDVNDDDNFFQDGYTETGGAQTLQSPVTVGGTTYPAGSSIQNEFSLLDNGLEVIVVRIDNVNVGFAYVGGPAPVAGDVLNFDDTRDGAGEDSLDQSTSSEEAYSNMVCYAAGTLILTTDGERPVESLKRNDLVVTLDHGPQPIRWTHSRSYPLQDVEPDTKPVQIKAGALGENLPSRDLIVSSQHRILVGGAGQLKDVFGSEAFASAKPLTALPGIRHMKGRKAITWFHFACDRHEVVTANGCLSESLLLGPMVVNGLHAGERAAVTSIFGPVSGPDAVLNGPPARECLTVGAVSRQLEIQLKYKRKLFAERCRKWDCDRAMERYESERLCKAASSGQHQKRILKAHRLFVGASHR